MFHMLQQPIPLVAETGIVWDLGMDNNLHPGLRNHAVIGAMNLSRTER